jgi:hypothetical protein
MESRNPPMSEASDTVTTFPTSVIRCPSVPPVKPIPYLFAASWADWLDLRVMPLQITSYASRRLATSGSRYPLLMHTSTPLLDMRYPMGWAADTTQFSFSRRSRRVSVGQSFSASQGQRLSRGRMDASQKDSRSL